MSYNFVPASPLAEAGHVQESESRGEALEGTSAFSVSAEWMTAGGRRRHRARGRGKLLIGEDSIGFSPSPSTRRLTSVAEVAHTEPDIAMTTARLGFPWSHTFLLLQNGTTYVRVGAPVFARGRLRRAIHASGIAVHETTSWRAPGLPRN